MRWKTRLNVLLELSAELPAFLHASPAHLSSSVKENVGNLQPNPYRSAELLLLPASSALGDAKTT